MLNSTGPNTIPCITLVGNFPALDTLPFVVRAVQLSSSVSSVFNPRTAFLEAGVNFSSAASTKPRAYLAVDITGILFLGRNNQGVFFS